MIQVSFFTISNSISNCLESFLIDIEKWLWCWNSVYDNITIKAFSSDLDLINFQFDLEIKAIHSFDRSSIRWFRYWIQSFRYRLKDISWYPETMYWEPNLLVSRRVNKQLPPIAPMLFQRRSKDNNYSWLLLKNPQKYANIIY